MMRSFDILVRSGPASDYPTPPCHPRRTRESCSEVPRSTYEASPDKYVRVCFYIARATYKGVILSHSTSDNCEQLDSYYGPNTIGKSAVGMTYRVTTADLSIDLPIREFSQTLCSMSTVLLKRRTDLNMIIAGSVMLGVSGVLVIVSARASMMQSRGGLGRPMTTVSKV